MQRSDGPEMSWRENVVARDRMKESEITAAKVSTVLNWIPWTLQQWYACHVMHVGFRVVWPCLAYLRSQKHGETLGMKHLLFFKLMTMRACSTGKNRDNGHHHSYMLMGKARLSSFKLPLHLIHRVDATWSHGMILAALLWPKIHQNTNKKWDYNDI